MSGIIIELEIYHVSLGTVSVIHTDFINRVRSITLYKARVRSTEYNVLNLGIDQPLSRRDDHAARALMYVCTCIPHIARHMAYYSRSVKSAKRSAL